MRQVFLASWFGVVMLTLLLLFCTAPQLQAATTGKIAGQILDAQSGEALPGVNVTVVGTTLGAATDLEGNYFIINIPPGTYSVRATMMGYTTVTQTEVRVKIGQTTPVDFKITQTTIAGEEVTIVAQRPVVELDLTSSKQTMSANQIANSWIGTVEQALNVQSGVNVHGGVRGGFGLDAPYSIDGQIIRDSNSNKSFTTLSKTAIQELEILTGGFNAEFGQASSAVINIVTKSAGQKYNGSVQYRYRPPAGGVFGDNGTYHWGGNLYGKDRWEWRKFDWKGKVAPGNVDFWDPAKGGKDGGAAYKNLTPAERLNLWQEIITEDPVLTEYSERAQWETDFTFSGPVPLIKKLGFMVTGRWKEGVLEYPSAYKYNPEWNLTGKLNYDITQNTRAIVSFTYFGTRNSGKYIYPFTGGSEVGGFGSGNPGAYYTTAYDAGKYWPFGTYGFGGGTSLGRVKPPEEVASYGGYFKLTHVFSPSTYLDVMYNHQQFERLANFNRVAKAWYSKGIVYPISGSALNNGFFVSWGEPGDRLWSINQQREHEVKIDFTSQINRTNQLKLGAMFSAQYVLNEIGQASSNTGATGISRFGLANDLKNPLPYGRPWEAAVYAQDKIEIVGMVVNAGLRLDMYNANKTVPPSIWDPLGLSTATEGHPADLKSGFYSYDPASGKKTPTQVALSPRIGISHPITSNTVLHFMYGHFNQRPGWTKIMGNGSVSWNDPTYANSTRPDLYFDVTKIPMMYASNSNQWNNPWLEFERTVQYEIGFDQNILDKVRVDVTLYYKDAKNQTTLGVVTGGNADASGFGTTGNPGVSLVGLPDQTAIVDGYSVPTNGGSYESRGVEISSETTFLRNMNFRLIYNMSYSVSDRYGPSTWYITLADGTKRGQDTWLGGNNSDGGVSGNTNERWNPNHTLKFDAVLRSPADFGPTLGSFYPLGDWTLNWFTQYASGRLYTYHAPGDFSTETNNKRWEPKMFTNLRVQKAIGVLGIRTLLSLDVINLFNQKQLRLFGGTEMDNYQLKGIKPFHSTTGEPLEWDWYELDLLPRQVFFGVGLEF